MQNHILKDSSHFLYIRYAWTVCKHSTAVRVTRIMYCKGRAVQQVKISLLSRFIIWQIAPRERRIRHKYHNNQMKNKIFFLPFILPLITIVKSDVGGHDLFTSLAQLEVLWFNELESIKVMERTILNMEKATKSLQK